MAAVIHNVLHQEPVKPRLIDSAIPRDLETICLKAMAKSAADRYPNCHEMAADLERWSSDEPIHARRINLIARARKWARRSPAIAGLATAVAVVTLIGLIGVSLAWSNANSARESAEKNLAIANQQSYRLRVLAAHRAWQNNNIDFAKELLDECLPSLRCWEWFYCKRICELDNLTINTGEPILDLTVVDDGQIVVTVDNHGTVRRSNLMTGDTEVVFENQRPVHAAKLCSNGLRVALAVETGHVVIHDLSKNRKQFEVTGKSEVSLNVVHASFSADGQKLAIADGQGSLKVLDGTVGRLIHRLRRPHPMAPGPAFGLRGLAWSPDGIRLAVAIPVEQQSVIPIPVRPDQALSPPIIAEVWNVSGTTPPVPVYGERNVGITNLVFSADGKTLCRSFRFDNHFMGW